METDAEESRRSLVVAVAVAAVIAVPIALSLSIPDMSSDRGVFVSVAERLNAGDQLYTQVWDNKDPLFYQLLALGRLISPVMDWVIELVWLLMAGLSTYSIARKLECPQAVAVLVGCVLTPLSLTGGATQAGYTHLPGTAVSLLAVAFALRDHWLMAGLVGGILLVLKLPTLPVLGLILVVMLLMRWSSQATTDCFLGGIATVCVSLGVLSVSGGLVPWIMSLQENASYSGVFGGPLDHLNRTFSDVSTWTVAATPVVLAIWGRPRRGALKSQLATWAAGLAAEVGGFIIVCMTGMWAHHTQVLLLGTCLLWCSVAPRIARRRTVAVVSVAALAAGGLSVWDFPRTLRDPGPRIAALGTETKEAGAIERHPEAHTYARLGQNDDYGLAMGLRSHALVCRYAQQYPFDPQSKYDETLSCIMSADVIVVAQSFQPEPDSPAWNRFVSQAGLMVESHYACTHAGTSQVCVKVGDVPGRRQPQVGQHPTAA